MDDDSEDFEYSVYFVGCTCDHEEKDHGWGCCDIEGCDCEGGFEE